SGVEVMLSSVNVQSGGGEGFQWTTDFNFSFNREEIRELYGGGEDDVGNEWFIGEPINVFYNYQQVGVWQSDQEDLAAEYNQIPGEIRVRDVNGDEQINASERVSIGQEMPILRTGMTTR